MKIGILTFHREENFGAAFQAYALLTFLRNNNIDAEIIDYDPKYRSDNRKSVPPVIFRKANWKQKVRMLLSAIKNYGKRRQRHNLFVEFQNRHFSLHKTQKIVDINTAPKWYDAVIAGSDQIWQPFVANNGKFDKAYFAGYPNTHKHLSYAASMGNLNMLTNESRPIFLNLVKEMDSILSREEDLNRDLSQNGFTSKLVSDPVFLLPKSYWEKFADNFSLEGLPERFVFLHRATDSQKNNLIIRDLLSQENLPIIVLEKQKLYFNQRVVKITRLEQIIYILSKATYVVTSSFHCTAFSLIFNTRLISYNKSPERAKTITSKLGVPYRCIADYSSESIQKIINDAKDVDYDKNEFVINSRNELLKMLQL